MVRIFGLKNYAQKDSRANEKEEGNLVGREIEIWDILEKLFEMCAELFSRATVKSTILLIQINGNYF